MILQLFEYVGSFAENKDIASDLRNNTIRPAIDKGEDIILDFEGVDGATQSFIHALISDLIRKYGVEIIDRISFKNCNTTIQKIISIVVDYMQQAE